MNKVCLFSCRTRKRIGVLYFAWLVLLTGPVGVAQVDNRIDYRTNQGGQLFDASNRVGGGRFNSRSINNRLQFDGGVSAQNIIWGNVSGLGRFQGSSPIPGPNSFRGALPSAGLASFRARSADLSQVGRRGLSNGGAYFDQSNTLTDLEGIRAGRNIPGSSMMRSPQININRGVPGAMRGGFNADFDDRLDARGSRLIDVTPFRRDNQSSYIRQVGADGRVASTGSDFSNAGVFASITQSTLFGAPGQLASDPTPARSPARRTTVEDLLRRSDRSSISARLAREELLNGSQLEINPKTEVDRANGGSDLLFDGTANANQIGVRQRTPFGDAPTEGDDLFARMIDAMRNKQSGTGNRFSGTKSRGARDEVPRGGGTEIGGDAAMGGALRSGERETGVFDGAEQAVKRAEPGTTQREAENEPTTTKYEAILNSPIRSFVAGAQSRVNQLMTLGEAALRERKFYAAAGHFEEAMTVDRDNPLPYLGRGHALAAAGDYRSAVLSIRLGIERFPEIANFDLDLLALVGQSDIFDRRRADLESLLTANENYELRFLLGYLELYSDLRMDGLNDLQKAAKGAPRDSVIAKFPDMLLGRLQPEAPSTARE